VAIEQTDELVALQRRALEEQARATAGVYSVEAWAPWLGAAQALDAAVTAYAAEHPDVNRLEVAKTVRRKALEASADAQVV
jgi:shikimate kinase